MSGEDCDGLDRGDNDGQKSDKMFTLKKWNAVAMWSWDVECDTCAICRVQVMDACLRCQGESKKDSYGKQDCVVVWGECNHSFHFCCMSLWVKQNNRCPLCQQEWSIQRMGKIRGQSRSVTSTLESWIPTCARAPSHVVCACAGGGVARAPLASRATRGRLMPTAINYCISNITFNSLSN